MFWRLEEKREEESFKDRLPFLIGVFFSFASLFAKSIDGELILLLGIKIGR